MNTKTSLVIASIALAILIRSLMTLHYFDISGDKIYQAAAAHNIANGNGYTVPLASPDDLSRTVQEPMILWPPAYSVIVSGIIKLTGSVTHAVFLMDLLNGAVFILLVYGICLALQFPAWLSILIVLFKGTEINDVIYASTATDYMSLNVCLLSIILLIRYIRLRESSMFWLFVFVNLLNPWIRYASIPLVIVLPLALAIVGLSLKDKQLQRQGLTALIGGLAGTAFLLLFNHVRSGQLFYVLESTPGFYPANLLHLPPVAWMSMLNINFVLTQLSLLTGVDYAILNNWLRISNFLLLGIVTVRIVAIFRQRNREKSFGSAAIFFFTAGLLALGTLASLALLSITRHRRFQLDQFWTYIEEQRYMLPVTVFLMFYFVYEFVFRRKYTLFRILLIFIMCVEVLHGIWVVTKGPFMPVNKQALLHFTPRTKALVDRIGTMAAAEGRELVLMDEDYNLRGYGILRGIAVFDDPSQFNGELRTGRPIEVLFRLKPGHEVLYPGFFQRESITDLGNVESAKFYSLRLDP